MRGWRGVFRMVALEPITRDQAPVLRNLFELYVHDFSEYVPIDLQPSGRFDVPVGDQWWAREDHFPFFIRASGKLGGFALVRRGSRVSAATDVMDVAEFFVLRGARRHGVGSAAAVALFDMFPGAWEIRIRRANPAALKFWVRVAASWLGQPVAAQPLSIEGVDWDLLRVEPVLGRPAPTESWQTSR
jgi:predicted acetyltransferase